MQRHFLLFFLLNEVSSGVPPKDEVVDFDPDLSLIKELICFQCKSDSRSKEPKCDMHYFKYNKKSDLIDLYFQCPYNRKNFCIKKVEVWKDHVLTWRGCNNATDNIGHYLHDGCIRKDGDFGMKYSLTCVCSENFCNASNEMRCTFSFILLISFLFYKT